MLWTCVVERERCVMERVVERGMEKIVERDLL